MGTDPHARDHEMVVFCSTSTPFPCLVPTCPPSKGSEVVERLGFHLVRPRERLSALRDSPYLRTNSPSATLPALRRIESHGPAYINSAGLISSLAYGVFARQTHWRCR
jgi:hypothetical protein